MRLGTLRASWACHCVSVWTPLGGQTQGTEYATIRVQIILSVEFKRGFQDTFRLLTTFLVDLRPVRPH
jgi:hypothetical protein